MKTRGCKYNGGRDIARPPYAACLPAKVLPLNDDYRDSHIHRVDDGPIRDCVHGLANDHRRSVADDHSADIHGGRDGGNVIGLPHGK